MSIWSFFKGNHWWECFLQNKIKRIYIWFDFHSEIRKLVFFPKFGKNLIFKRKTKTNITPNVKDQFRYDFQFLFKFYNLLRLKLTKKKQNKNKTKQKTNKQTTNKNKTTTTTTTKQKKTKTERTKNKTKNKNKQKTKTNKSMKVLSPKLAPSVYVQRVP